MKTRKESIVNLSLAVAVLAFFVMGCSFSVGNNNNNSNNSSSGNRPANTSSSSNRSNGNNSSSGNTASGNSANRSGGGDSASGGGGSGEVSAGGGGSSQRMATITINHMADWTVREFYMSPTNERRWGPDQLGARTLSRGGSFTVTDVPCEEYDIRLVDEDGDECIITGVVMCNDNNVWNLTNNELLSCEGFGR